MTKFKDSADREWIVSVTVGAIKNIRTALGVDLADPSQAVMERLADDPVLLVDLLWLLCEKQAKEIGITPEQFGESLVGDPIDAATNAMVEAIADFFPGPRRSLLQRANAKTRAVRQKAESLAMEKLNDPTLEAEMEKAMTKRLEAEVRQALTRLSSPTS